MTECLIDLAITTAVVAGILAILWLTLPKAR